MAEQVDEIFAIIQKKDDLTQQDQYTITILNCHSTSPTLKYCTFKALKMMSELSKEHLIRNIIGELNRTISQD
jgi:hypothetical protein